MHHSGGAAAETLYIYAEPFKNALSALIRLNKNELAIGVVGFGLGYIELAFLHCLSNHLPNSVIITSFEKDLELREKFKAWVTGECNATYDLICEKLKIDKIVVLEILKSLNWNCSEELNLETKSKEKFNFVAYDAFSQFTDGPLWTDHFLDFFLTNLCATDCVFATYACTGQLKRALIRNKFIFIKRTGFSNKRDATLALRGEFTIHQHLFQNV